MCKFMGEIRMLDIKVLSFRNIFVLENIKLCVVFSVLLVGEKVYILTQKSEFSCNNTANTTPRQKFYIFKTKIFVDDHTLTSRFLGGIA